MLKKTFWKIYAFFYFKIMDFLADNELFGRYWLKRIKQPKLRLGNTEALGVCPYCHKWIDGFQRHLSYTQSEKDEIKTTIEWMEKSILDLKNVDNCEIANIDSMSKTRKRMLN